MDWRNELTAAFKIDYPIIQAPMLGVTTPVMVAEIANAGGLGSLPVGGLSPEKTTELIQKTKQLTTRPFAVNLFAHDNESADKKPMPAMQNFLESLCRQNNIPYEKQPVESFTYYSYKEQVSILINENIPIVSFTFGILNDESIKALQQNNTLLAGTATSVKEAGLLDQKGIDVICAQGIEAGGHRGSFLEDEPLPMIGSMALIPQIVKAISKPVIAAGGINDGRTIKAAFMLGAKGVQVGTAFITSEESAAAASYKEAVLNASDADSILTRSFSGRWARGIKNKFITEVENCGKEIPGYPLQVSLTSSIRVWAQQNNNKDFTALWAGQSPRKGEIKPAASIFHDLIKQTEALQ